MLGEEPVCREKPTNPLELRSVPSCRRAVLGRDVGSFQGRHLKAAGGCSWEGNPADISNVLVCLVGTPQGSSWKGRVRSLFFLELILGFNPGLEAFRRKSLCSLLMGIVWIK